MNKKTVFLFLTIISAYSVFAGNNELPFSNCFQKKTGITLETVYQKDGLGRLVDFKTKNSLTGFGQITRQKLSLLRTSEVNKQIQCPHWLYSVKSEKETIVMPIKKEIIQNFDGEERTHCIYSKVSVIDNLRAKDELETLETQIICIL